MKYFSDNLMTSLYRGDLLAFDADVSFNIVLQSFQLGDHCSYMRIVQDLSMNMKYHDGIGSVLAGCHQEQGENRERVEACTFV